MKPSNRVAITISGWVLALSLIESVNSEPVFLRLAANLNEPRGFCIDLSGYGENINWKNPVQTHTCKRTISHGDQVIESENIGSSVGILYLPVYDICIEAENTTPGSQLLLDHCKQHALQHWRYAEDGRIQPAENADMCLTIGDEADEAGTPPGVRQYWIRTLALEPCSETDTERQVWSLEEIENYMPGPSATLKSSDQ